jgi:hypothetical protein
MNYANQAQLVQTTNTNLVGIRSIELNYFQTFFNSFSIQSTLLIGISTALLSQTPALGVLIIYRYF